MKEILLAALVFTAGTASAQVVGDALSELKAFAPADIQIAAPVDPRPEPVDQSEAITNSIPDQESGYAATRDSVFQRFPEIRLTYENMKRVIERAQAHIVGLNAAKHQKHEDSKTRRALQDLSSNLVQCFEDGDGSYSINSDIIYCEGDVAMMLIGTIERLGARRTEDRLVYDNLVAPTWPQGTIVTKHTLDYQLEDSSLLTITCKYRSAYGTPFRDPGDLDPYCALAEPNRSVRK